MVVSLPSHLNTVLSQIPQCTSPISPKSPFCNRNVLTPLIEHLFDIIVVAIEYIWCGRQRESEVYCLNCPLNNWFEHAITIHDWLLFTVGAALPRPICYWFIHTMLVPSTPGEPSWLPCVPSLCGWTRSTPIVVHKFRCFNPMLPSVFSVASEYRSRGWYRSDPMLYHRSWSSMVQVMAWCLIGTKPFPEPMMTYHHKELQKLEYTQLSFQWMRKGF